MSRKQSKPAVSYRYALVLVEDELGLSQYEHGDYSPGKRGERQRAEVERRLANNGLWGYELYRRIDAHECPTCSREAEWVEVDSCGGFIGSYKNGLAGLRDTGILDYVQDTEYTIDVYSAGRVGNGPSEFDDTYADFTIPRKRKRKVA